MGYEEEMGFPFMHLFKFQYSDSLQNWWGLIYFHTFYNILFWHPSLNCHVMLICIHTSISELPVCNEDYLDYDMAVYNYLSSL